jgi:hypothetical protein
MNVRVLLAVLLLTLQLRPLAAAVPCLVGVGSAAEAVCGGNGTHSRQSAAGHQVPALHQNPGANSAQPTCAVASWCATAPLFALSGTPTQAVSPEADWGARLPDSVSPTSFRGSPPVPPPIL